MGLPTFPLLVHTIVMFVPPASELFLVKAVLVTVATVSNVCFEMIALSVSLVLLASVLAVALMMSFDITLDVP